MCRPLLNRWVQPFGVFASRSAASGEDLFRLLISAIIRIELHWGRVLAVVSDGAQTNKTVWRLAGVGDGDPTKPTEDVINNSMKHPLVKDHKIFFLQDPPHLFMCIRNQMYNHETVQCRGLLMEPHKLVTNPFAADSVFGETRVCPKLRYIHVHPTAFQKMSVKLAVQVFIILFYT